MRRSICVVALLCSCLGTAQAARSAPILDQQFIPSRLSTGEFSATMFATLGMGLRAQTFTVGFDGMLTDIEVLLDTTGLEGGQRTFEIYSTDGGVPDVGAAALASVSIAFAPDAMAFYAGTLSAPFLVEAGAVLAIADRGLLPGGDAYWAGNYDTDPDASHYSAGAAYGPTWTEPIGLFGGDLGFRTFVDPDYAEPPPPPPPNPVPEPATVLLVGTGAALAALRRRR